MKSYRLLEIKTKDESQPVTVFQGQDLEKADIHSAYHLTKGIISLLMSWDPPQYQFDIVYEYKNENLSVFFRIPDGAETLLLNSIPGATWTLDNVTLGFNPCRYGGSIDPVILNGRNGCLIDNLIENYYNVDFTVAFCIHMIENKDINHHLKYLEKVIEVLSLLRSEQYSDRDGFARNFFAGRTKSLQYEVSKYDTWYKMYSHHYSSVYASNKQLSYLTVNVYSAETETRDSIGKFIEAYASTPGYPSPHVIKKELASSSGDALKRDYYKRAIENVFKYSDINIGKPKPDDKERAKKLFEIVKSNYDDYIFFNYIGAAEVAAVVSLPFKKHTGLYYRDDVSFGTESVSGSEAKKINVGYLTRIHETSIPVDINCKDLTRHALITGVTGSGKTTTIKHILFNCLAQNIPFMVVEPAKTEYSYFATDKVCVMGKPASTRVTGSD